MKRFYHIFALCFCISAIGCGCAKPAADDGQSGKPYIKLGISEKLVTNASGSFEVYVESNTSWTVEPQAEWLSVSISNGNGNRNVTIRTRYGKIRRRRDHSDENHRETGAQDIQEPRIHAYARPLYLEGADRREYRRLLPVQIRRQRDQSREDLQAHRMGRDFLCMEMPDFPYCMEQGQSLGS